MISTDFLEHGLSNVVAESQPVFTCHQVNDCFLGEFVLIIKNSAQRSPAHISVQVTVFDFYDSENNLDGLSKFSKWFTDGLSYQLYTFHI